MSSMLCNSLLIEVQQGHNRLHFKIKILPDQFSFASKNEIHVRTHFAINSEFEKKIKLIFNYIKHITLISYIQKPHIAYSGNLKN